MALAIGQRVAERVLDIAIARSQDEQAFEYFDTLTGTPASTTAR